MHLRWQIYNGIISFCEFLLQHFSTGARFLRLVSRQLHFSTTGAILLLLYLILGLRVTGGGVQYLSNVKI